jgi:cytoskeletal protein RodZ
MLIDKDYLKSFSPCKDRYKHYLENYSSWSGTLKEFLDLPKLTHADKKWVFFRSIPIEKLQLVAADFAERVLHIYESKYPNDNRPRKAIEAARSGDKNAATAADAAATAAAATATDATAATAAVAAATAATAATVAAAIAAAATAATAAIAADAATAAATAAIAADAATAAATAAAADAARKKEENAQLEIMKRYTREALKGGE